LANLTIVVGQTSCGEHSQGIWQDTQNFITSCVAFKMTQSMNPITLPARPWARKTLPFQGPQNFQTRDLSFNKNVLNNTNCRSILGFILVNTQKKRVLVSMMPHHGAQQRDARSLSLSRKLDIARTFYRTVVGAVLPSCATPSPHITEVGGTLMPDHTSHTKLKHQVSEVHRD
jgi:hypothetical protein